MGEEEAHGTIMLLLSCFSAEGPVVEAEVTRQCQQHFAPLPTSGFPCSCALQMLPLVHLPSAALATKTRPYSAEYASRLPLPLPACSRMAVFGLGLAGAATGASMTTARLKRKGTRSSEPILTGWLCS